MRRHRMVTVWRARLVDEDGLAVVVVVLGDDADDAADAAENQTGAECVLVEAIDKARAFLEASAVLVERG